MANKPIFYFTRMLPAYRVPILERLNDRLDGRLVVCYGQAPQENPVLKKSQPGSFRKHRLRNFWIKDTAVHCQFFKGVFQQYGAPSVVLAEESPRSVMLPSLLRHAQKAGAGRVLWGIFYSVHRSFDAKHPLQRYRISMARKVEACVCYAQQSKKYLAPHVGEEKLFVAQNTLDTDELSRLRRTWDCEGRESVRKKLGLPLNGPLFVFSAQLVKRKGTAELVEIFSRFSKNRDASLIVIGDGPERSEMEAHVHGAAMANVSFLGAISDFRESAPYIYAADLMLIPGYVGLAVSHAFALGVPIVTQEAPQGIPFHGPEVESIVHGSNGMIVKRGDDLEMLKGLEHVIDNRDAFSFQASSYAALNLGVDNMVDGIVNAIDYASPRTRLYFVRSKRVVDSTLSSNLQRDSSQ